VRRLAIDAQRFVGACDERNAEIRHRDVLGTRELPASAARRAQCRCEFVRGVALDDRDLRRRREALDEIGDGRADDAAADDRDVVAAHGVARVTRPS